jgi:hypothetical protein
MKENLMTGASLRDFLLGNLDDDDREEIEALFLTDSQARERVLTAEQDLIEDYLEDSLTKADKERFLSLYAQTDEQRQKLRITKSIKDWAFTEARVSQPFPAMASIWSRLRTQLRLNPVFVVPIAVTIVLAIILAIIWLNNEQRKHLAVEQELAQLNSPTSLREVPAQMISLELRPVTVRSVESQTEFNPRSQIRIIELHLPWIQKERYSTYQAEIRGVGDDEAFTIRNLQSETEGTHLIRIRLPVHMLHRGHYQIQLKGIANDGSASPAEEYQFGVSR